MQVYACFAALGVAGSKDSSSVSQDGLAALQQLPAADLATLAVIQQYTAFRQGEVWQDIRAGFSAEGLQLTQEDRCVVPCLVCSRNLVFMLHVLAVQTGSSSRLSFCFANIPVISVTNCAGLPHRIGWSSSLKGGAVVMGLTPAAVAVLCCSMRLESGIRRAEMVAAEVQVCGVSQSCGTKLGILLQPAEMLGRQSWLVVCLSPSGSCSQRTIVTL